MGLWTLLCVFAALPLSCASPPPEGFNGGRAFDDLRRIVALGPRPSGSAALARTRAEIAKQFKAVGLTIEEDNFTAFTPRGRVAMTNLLVRIQGEDKRIVVVSGHYETKLENGFQFVGANDAGSSTAFLIELGRVLAMRKNKLTYWIVFFDGEAAMVDFSESDGLYGSRHLVQKLAATGELGRIEALINVDMVADADLNIHREGGSTGWLLDRIWNNASRLGYSRYFEDSTRYYVDDHIPFVQAGVPAVDLLDFEYGPRNRYWHTAQDTIDKCSPLSLTIVGRVVLATLEDLESSLR